MVFRSLSNPISNSRHVSAIIEERSKIDGWSVAGFYVGRAKKLFTVFGYPYYSSEALIGSLHFLKVDKHGQQQDKIKTGFTQRRGERRERLLMGKLCRLFLTLRSLRLKRAKRTGMSQAFCFSCFRFSDALLERNR